VYKRQSLLSIRMLPLLHAKVHGTVIKRLVLML
jgi:hypothetical protein